jgi:hypothetical protein
LELHLDGRALNIINEALNICPESDEALRVRNSIHAERARIDLLQKASIREIKIVEENYKQINNWYDEDNFVNKYGLYK